MTTPVVLDGNALTIAEVFSVAVHAAPVSLAPSARQRVLESRRHVEAIVKRKDVVYGVTTGFGKLSEMVIPEDRLAELQVNLVRSHAAGVGDLLPERVVRAMMLLRANVLAKGFSGARPALAELLIGMLNAGLYPPVPEQGSVGASGDLAPLAHLTSVLIGYEAAEAWYEGVRMPAPQALAKAGIAPVSFELKAKDCLALINGNSLCAAMAALNVHDAERLMKQADIAGALSLEAIRGEQAAFDARIHAVRKQPGQIAAADNVRRLTRGSRRTTEAARAVRLPDDVLHPTHTPRVQDQYSFRCLPQVHGSCRDNLAYCKTLIERELNAATDNPLVFWDAQGQLEFLSGGNFHCEQLAFAMDIVAMSLAEIGNISERRLFALCDATLSYGLPPNLAGRPIGLNTGYATISGSAAAIASENKTLCFPAVVDSIPTKSNQEDHVSMAAWSCRKTRQILDNLPKILGIEYLFGARAISLTRDELGEFELGAGTAIAFKTLSEAIGFQNDDRYMPAQTGPAVRLTEEGAVLAAVEGAIGPLQ